MMKKKDEIEIDSILKGLPDNLVELITEMTEGTNYHEKHTARKALVKQGRSILPHLHKLLDNENNLLRKEVTSVVALIAHSSSIPYLIERLKDKESVIRWIACEGLIKIGKRSIVPLLSAVRDSDNSYFLDNGAHHVLNSLLTEKQKKKLQPLMHSLRNSNQLGGIAPAEASKAIKTVFRHPSYT